MGYVKIITRNKFIDRLKRQLRHPEPMLPWDEETARAVAPSTDRGADGTAADTEADVWAAVRELPDDQQRVLQGIYVEGKTYREVSDDTGIPLGTLKRRLRASLGALRARLSEGG